MSTEKEHIGNVCFKLYVFDSNVSDTESNMCLVTVRASALSLRFFEEKTIFSNQDISQHATPSDVIPIINSENKAMSCD